MKVNQWTLGLAAVGLVSLPAIMQAEEKATPLMTALTSTTISGYVNTSMEWNPGTGNNVNPPGFAFNRGKQDGFNLDVVKLTIERPLDEAQWAAGYKVDLIFGPDANALNTSSGAPLGGVNSDFGIKQAYVALRAPVGNGLDFKIGVWDTLMGYEVFDAGSNPNYTRSYGYSMEPTTHTGVQANYQVSPVLSLAVAIADTFGPTINQRANPPKSESSKSYMGSITLTAPDSFGALKGATLYGCAMNGVNKTALGGGNESQTSWYAGTTIPTPLTGLKVGAAYDYAGVDHDPDTGNPSTYQNAASLYASFQATEKLSFHARGEYFWQGTSSVASSGLPHKVIALTGTLQYDLWKNVLSRLEVRWDHSADGNPAFNGSIVDGEPTGPTMKNAVLVAANIIYKF